MRAIEAADLLALWERGARRHALDRSAMLCAFARPDLPADGIADLPLGTVTASLLRLREASFGARIESHVDCRHCGQRLELNLNIAALLQPDAADGSGGEVEVDGILLRAPCLRDLAAIAHEHDAERAARELLARCRLDQPDTATPLADTAMQATSDALEALDPNADLAFTVQCEACGRASTAQLDAGELLWVEIDARARALLGDIHALASAYGWTEREILALGPTRRATYLAMVSA